MVCVRQAGYDYTDKEFDAVFLRIYGIFGSSAPYEVYEDVKPFLRWVRTQGIVVGVLSNASYRYRDDILPLLGLKQVRLPHPSACLSGKECAEAQLLIWIGSVLCAGRGVGFRGVLWH